MASFLATLLGIAMASFAWLVFAGATFNATGATASRTLLVAGAALTGFMVVVIAGAAAAAVRLGPALKPFRTAFARTTIALGSLFFFYFCLGALRDTAPWHDRWYVLVPLVAVATVLLSSRTR